MCVGSEAVVVVVGQRYNRLHSAIGGLVRSVLLDYSATTKPT